NRQRDDFFRFALCVPLRRFANLSDAICRVRLRFLLHAADELVLGVLRGHSGHLLEPTALVAHELFQFLFTVGDRLLSASELARPLPQLLVALLEHLKFAVEDGIALGDAAFLSLDLLAAPANLLLEAFAQADDLFLARDD